MKRFFVLPFAIFLISTSVYGGMHFSKRECAVNWHTLGVKEGREGGPMRSLARMASECPRYGYQVNKPQYQAGWQLGRQQRAIRETKLCNEPANAFALGKANEPYPNVCSPHTYPFFKSEYERGELVGERIKELQDQIRDIDDEIRFRLRGADLVQMDSGFYRLSSREKSAYAKVAVESVNEFVRKKKPLEAKLFKLQMIN